MNIYNYSLPPFCKASAEELEAIKYFYGLQMDTSALLAVQKHFYTLELRDPTADELALLALIEAAPDAGTLLAEARMPHGLPGALQWAACAVIRAFGGPLDFPVECTGCPFAQSV